MWSAGCSMPAISPFEPFLEDFPTRMDTHTSMCIEGLAGGLYKEREDWFSVWKSIIYLS